MAPNGRVSRGNTSDLVGLWNKLAASEAQAQPVRSRSRSPISGNLTTPNQFKFRKVSAFEPGTSSLLSPDSARLETPHVRKTSALVLMPSNPRQSVAIDSESDDGNGSYRPRKTSAMSTLSVQVGYPLKSALKNSNTNLNQNQDQVSVIPTVVTSPPPVDSKQMIYENNGRRGSGLGRSKSVKCNRVKFGLSDEDKNDGSSSKDYHKSSDSTLSPFDKFRSMDNKNIENSQITSGRLTRQASLPSVSAPTSAPPPVDSSANNSNPAGSPTGPKRSIMSRSPSSTKELLLMWAQQRTNTYPNLNVTNFSTCWNDGMAFCALIHYYYPEAFEYDKLDPKNRRENFALAFKAAEDYAGICPLLDVEDMVMMLKPDWKCVFTYVQSFYRRFRNGRDPPPPVRTLTFTPDDDQVRPKEKPLSTEVQKSLLSKYMIDDEEDSLIKKRGISKGRTSTLSSQSFSFSSTRSSNLQTTTKSGSPDPAYLSKLNDLKSIALNRKSAERDSSSLKSSSTLGISEFNIGDGGSSQLSIGTRSTESIRNEVTGQYSELQKKVKAESLSIASFALGTSEGRRSNSESSATNSVDGVMVSQQSKGSLTSKYSSDEKSVRSKSSSKKPPLPSLPPPSLPG